MVHLFSNACEQTIEAAKKHGCKIIVDWGIAEPRVLMAVMKQEAMKVGISFKDDFDIDKNLKMLNAADIILVPSDYVFSTFEATEFSSKLLKIPYGCPAPLAKNRSLNKKGWTPKICFAGHFSLRKGAPAILKVVKMLKNELNVQFDIIGGIDHSIQLFIVMNYI